MAVASYPATVKTGSTVINDIMTAELPFKMNTVETTAFSTTTPGTQTFIPTLLGMQVKLSGSWNKTDTGQSTLETNFFARTKTSFTISPDGVKNYTFSGWISDYSIKADPKGKVDTDFTIQLDGGITIS